MQVGGGEGATHSGPSLIRTLILLWVPTLRMSSKPNRFPKAPPSNTMTLEVQASKYKFWGGHKHSVQNRREEDNPFPLGKYVPITGTVQVGNRFQKMIAEENPEEAAAFNDCRHQQTQDPALASPGTSLLLFKL